jgi:hypothetical protein
MVMMSQNHFFCYISHWVDVIDLWTIWVCCCSSCYGMLTSTIKCPSSLQLILLQWAPCQMPNYITMSWILASHKMHWKLMLGLYSKQMYSITATRSICLEWRLVT